MKEGEFGKSLVLLLIFSVFLRYAPLLLHGQFPGFDIFIRSIEIELIASDLAYVFQLGRPPLYYLVFAAIGNLSGLDIYFLNGVLGPLIASFTVVVIWFVADRLFDRRTAVFSSLVYLFLVGAVYEELVVFQIENLINAHLLIPLFLLYLVKTVSLEKVYYYRLAFLGVLIASIHHLTLVELGVIAPVYLFAVGVWNRELLFQNWGEIENRFGRKNMLFVFLLFTGLNTVLLHLYLDFLLNIFSFEIFSTTAFLNSVSFDQPFINHISGFNKFISLPVPFFAFSGFLLYWKKEGIDPAILLAVVWTVTLFGMYFLFPNVRSLSPLRFLKDAGFPLSILVGCFLAELCNSYTGNSSLNVGAFSLEKKHFKALLVISLIVSTPFAIQKLDHQLSPDYRGSSISPEDREIVEFLDSKNSTGKIMTSRNYRKMKYLVNKTVLPMRAMDTLQYRASETDVRFQQRLNNVWTQPGSLKAERELSRRDVDYIVVWEPAFRKEIELQTGDIEGAAWSRKELSTGNATVFRVEK